ncbi:uncharacterized protein FOMMEDRAFT_151015 [Fomitiporia mediterranea MF3/22]|uniref:uncharacterized protein n=1 Tax=Fomitiporia mediterranea (strain MF3/22) TaxID=694068 RepID=UPI000440802C|nr:uncharacterized protein FOMMEDRAFT_151015 [Fomitiporia mediterranea MF3/22]EJD08268.1 hypothetical protein FOMMEDRAFT_151015 [Fomitiporia mediterranea MF3/22]
MFICRISASSASLFDATRNTGAKGLWKENQKKLLRNEEPPETASAAPFLSASGGTIAISNSHGKGVDYYDTSTSVASNDATDTHGLSYSPHDHSPSFKYCVPFHLLVVLVCSGSLPVSHRPGAAHTAVWSELHSKVDSAPFVPKLPSLLDVMRLTAEASSSSRHPSTLLVNINEFAASTPQYSKYKSNLDSQDIVPFRKYT